MIVVLSLNKLDPRQISRQHYTEEREQYRNQINDGAGGLERIGIDLHPGLAITVKSRKNKQHPCDDRDHAQPCGYPGRRRRLSLELKKLLERDREPANRKSENNGGDASSNPCQKSTFVGKVIAGAAEVV